MGERNRPGRSWPATMPVIPAGSLLPERTVRNTTLAVAIIVPIGVAQGTPHGAGPHALLAWLAALTFAVAFPFAALRREIPAWALATAIGLSGAGGVAMEAMSLFGIGIMMTIVAITQASRLATPVGPILAALITIGYEAVAVAQSRSFDPGNLLSSTAGLVFAYLAMSSFRRLRAEKVKTDSLLREVLAGRDAQIHAATLDERARIAREIHDILAHTLSALAVQLEGTRLLVEQRPGDPATVAALERASGLARDGLEETKRAVGALRGDELPGPEALPRLAADFEHDTGIPCRLTVEGAENPLTPEARLSLYRTAQEALTNVRKHALASSVAILLRYAANEAELTVEDEGTARPTPLAGSGHGLEGMRERAALARGRLEAGPTATGFRVRLWLPT